MNPRHGFTRTTVFERLRFSMLVWCRVIANRAAWFPILIRLSQFMGSQYRPVPSLVAIWFANLLREMVARGSSASDSK